MPIIAIDKTTEENITRTNPYFESKNILIYK
jgi:hypothetical protein